MAEYIEREALKEHLRSYTGMFTDELGFVVKLDAVLGGIDFQPAADVAPVVHGRWREECVPGFNRVFTTVFACSECKKRYRVPNMNYCPNCGANMDAELLKGGDTNEKEK